MIFMQETPCNGPGDWFPGDTRNAIAFRIDRRLCFRGTISCLEEIERFKAMSSETNNNLTPEQMAARIAELEGRLAKGSSLSFKVSEKGGVSVYGLGRFPVTLYLEQWDALLSHAAELREFIEANKSRLKTKDQTKR